MAPILGFVNGSDALAGLLPQEVIRATCDRARVFVLAF
jgi:hypothetical protein